MMSIARPAVLLPSGSDPSRWGVRTLVICGLAGAPESSIGRMFRVGIGGAVRLICTRRPGPVALRLPATSTWKTW